MEEINIPTKMCKKFLQSTGLRASKEAIDKFKENLLAYGKIRANELGEKAKSQDRKTIQAEDFLITESA